MCPCISKIVEVVLGVTYQEIDDYLEGKEVSDKAADQIEKLWNKSYIGWADH